MLCFQNARFLVSAGPNGDLPPDTGAEIAFVGRSNAGKSSALNAIAQQRGLARVSKTPGRTQLVNFFALDARYRLVDLPGYGYAHAPPAAQRAWEQLVRHYLATRASLRGIVLVMDARHGVSELDAQVAGWAQGAELALHVVLTKADKLGHAGQQAALKALQASLPNVPATLFSATKGLGVAPVRGALSRILEGERKKAPETRGENPGPGEVPT